MHPLLLLLEARERVRTFVSICMCALSAQCVHVHIMCIFEAKSSIVNFNAICMPSLLLANAVRHSYSWMHSNIVAKGSANVAKIWNFRLPRKCKRSSLICDCMICDFIATSILSLGELLYRWSVTAFIFILYVVLKSYSSHYVYRVRLRSNYLTVPFFLFSHT